MATVLVLVLFVCVADLVVTVLVRRDVGKALDEIGRVRVPYGRMTGGEKETVSDDGGDLDMAEIGKALAKAVKVMEDAG